jgi:hypothetical protein
MQEYAYVESRLTQIAKPAYHIPYQQWELLYDALLDHPQVIEMTVAVDTKGFRNDTASAYAVSGARGVRGTRAGLQPAHRAC